MEEVQMDIWVKWWNDFL